MAAEFEVIDIDGVRVVFPDGWGLVRASNTSPVVVVRCEAKTPERRDEIQAMITALGFLLALAGGAAGEGLQTFFERRLVTTRARRPVG